MDTIIFALILASFLAFHRGKQTTGLGLFFASLVIMVLLFNHHVTSSLKLGF